MISQHPAGRTHGTIALHAAALVGSLLLAATLTGCNNFDREMNKALEPLFPPSPGETARQAFNVYDADKRRDSVARLSAAPYGGEEAYLRLYRLLIDDPDATVRAACVKALSEHGGVEDMTLILPRMKDDFAFVRWEAAKSLQRIHDVKAIQPLIEAATKDEDADVRLASSDALGQYPEPRVFTALVTVLNDSDFGVVEAAQRSLKALTGYDMGSDGAMWLIWRDQNPGKMFAHQQPYKYQPYVKPRGLWDKAQFWKTPPPNDPRAPKGLAAETQPAAGS